MKLCNYKHLIGKSKEKIEELKEPLRIARIKKQAQMDLGKINDRISILEGAIEEECFKYPLNFIYIIDMLDEIDLCEHRKNRYQEIIENFFD